ncbi:hypothetical protein V8D89_003993 [Ganoderma adspersum]
MAIFSKLSAKSSKTIDKLSASANKAKAKVGSHLPRGKTVLSGVNIAAAVAGKLGGSVPYMQGMVDAANEVVACAEAMKNNRKECKKISALTEELVRGLLAETEGVDEDDLSEQSRLNMADLEWKLETIGGVMKEMRKTTLVRRLLSKGEHATQLVDQRRALQDAIAKFQLMQFVRVDVCLARLEKNQHTLSTASQSRVAVRGSDTRASIQEP